MGQLRISRDGLVNSDEEKKRLAVLRATAKAEERALAKIAKERVEEEYEKEREAAELEGSGEEGDEDGDDDVASIVGRYELGPSPWLMG